MKYGVLPLIEEQIYISQVPFDHDGTTGAYGRTVMFGTCWHNERNEIGFFILFLRWRSNPANWNREWAKVKILSAARNRKMCRTCNASILSTRNQCLLLTASPTPAVRYNCTITIVTSQQATKPFLSAAIPRLDENFDWALCRHCSALLKLSWHIFFPAPIEYRACNRHAEFDHF